MTCRRTAARIVSTTADAWRLMCACLQGEGLPALPEHPAGLTHRHVLPPDDGADPLADPREMSITRGMELAAAIAASRHWRRRP